MTEVAIGEAHTEPTPIPPAPDVAAELEAAPAEAAAPADDILRHGGANSEPSATERAMPELDHPIGPLRQAVLDALLDNEGPRTVSQILTELPPGTSRNTAESAIKRCFDAGQIERVAPGTYVLAKPKPAEPPKPAPMPSPPADEAVLFAALDAWTVDPASWDVAAWGPPPNDPASTISLDVRRRFFDRVRKRAERRRDAEAAAAKQAAADRQLRDKLIEACHGNIVLGPEIDDVSPIRAALELVPLDTVLTAIRGKVDLCLPTPPPVREWREPRLLEAIAKMYCRHLARRLVAVWSKAEKAPGKPVDAEEALPAAPEPAAPENAPAASPPQPVANPDDGPPIDPVPAADAAPTRESILAAFNRDRTSPQLASPPPAAAPQPRSDEHPWFADPQARPREELSPEAVDELIAGWRAGNLAWLRRLLDEEPGHPDCRLSPSVLRRNGLA